MAARRNIAHSSAKSVAAMVTMDSATTNEVKDGKTVLVFEHRLALAEQLRSTPTYMSVEEEYHIEVHEYEADATHRQAIEKSKVHVSSVGSTICSQADISRADESDTGAFDLDRFAQDLVSTCTFADLQSVVIVGGSSSSPG